MISLRDIKAVTLECNVCGARATLPLDKFQTLPRTCPGADEHNWADGAPPPAKVLYALRDAVKAPKGTATEPRGFEVYLELDDVKS